MKSEEAQIKGSSLEKPLRITEQAWPEGTVPVVSVFSWAYNHAQFIRESIESILMQETTFPVEIIIHDDASTDGTAEIIREYESKHPQLFRNILQKENQWSQGKSVMDPLFLSPRGEFVALTHGDDYWICKEKLQKQVEILEVNPDYTLVSHFTKWIDAQGNFLMEDWGRNNSYPDEVKEYVINDVIKYAFAHPNTWVYRQVDFDDDFLEYFKCLPYGDDTLCFYLLNRGKKGLSIGKIWSVYRRHGGGVWSAISDFHRKCQDLVYYSCQKKKYYKMFHQEFELLIKEKRNEITNLLYPQLRNMHLYDFTSNLFYIKKYHSRYFNFTSEFFILSKRCILAGFKQLAIKFKP